MDRDILNAMPPELAAKIKRDLAGERKTSSLPNGLTLVLPYPPSVNHYWGRGRGGRMFVSKKGHDFRKEVWAVILLEEVPSISGPLALEIALHPPDAS
jgi:hypothetical protein